MSGTKEKNHDEIEEGMREKLGMEAAFPRPVNSAAGLYNKSQKGMSKRLYIATQISKSLINKDEYFRNNDNQTLIKESYKITDELLKQENPIQSKEIIKEVHKKVLCKDCDVQKVCKNKIKQFTNYILCNEYRDQLPF